MHEGRLHVGCLGKGYIDQFADLAEVCYFFDDQGELLIATAAAE